MKFAAAQQGMYFYKAIGVNGNVLGDGKLIKDLGTGN
jgi:hypothetical protein